MSEVPCSKVARRGKYILNSSGVCPDNPTTAACRHHDQLRSSHLRSASRRDRKRAVPSMSGQRTKTMTLAPGEFIRRFMLHVLPKGFHRIRHLRPIGELPHQGRDAGAHPRVHHCGRASADNKAAAAHRRRCNRRQPAVSLPMLRRSHAEWCCSPVACRCLPPRGVVMP
jgi:hypothetical protein